MRRPVVISYRPGAVPNGMGTLIDNTDSLDRHAAMMPFWRCQILTRHKGMNKSSLASVLFPRVKNHEQTQASIPPNVRPSSPSPILPPRQ